MPQTQNIVDVILKDGRKFCGIATGNNASWLCVCGYSYPLLGRSGFLGGVSDGMRVDCPECDRKYFIVPTDKDMGPVLKVEEVNVVT